MKLRVVASPGDVTKMANTGHRMSASDGEAAAKLLDAQGYPEKAPINARERGSACPFHEEPGAVGRGKQPNFYLNKRSGLFTCFSASCGEKGNLRALERLFGIDVEDDWVTEVTSREVQLQAFEMDLTTSLRRPFYEHGLTDQTIERFRLGYDRTKGRYIIPYLVGRRPRYFRYYKPQGDPKWKYTWEEGAEAGLFNAHDAMGDSEGLVVVTESEQKAMLLVQMGYAAVGVPGASIWRQEWVSLFTHARKIVVLFDNDSLEHHNYDRPAEGKRCQKCAGAGLSHCIGHNPGQDAALARVEQLGWRARNAVLPLPLGAPKTDVNDYVMRDGASVDDLRALITGKPADNYRVRNFAEIEQDPPEQAAMLVGHGVLPVAGRLLVAGSPKAGKAGLTTTPVLTPMGWRTMGDLEVGDAVIGSDGRPTEVIAVHPQGESDVFRVTMSDGSSTCCTAQHLWAIQSHDDRIARRGYRVVETADVAQILAADHRRHTYIPIVEPVQYSPIDLPLDPYALGLLLGDGYLAGRSTPSFVKPDLELHEALRAIPGVALTTVNAEQGAVLLVRETPTGPNPVADIARGLQLSGCRSWEKAIPPLYLHAAIDQRLALLQGLLDTDGWVEHNDTGNTSSHYGTSSPTLKDQVVELVESLGGVARVQYKSAPKFQDGGVGRPAWSIGVRLPQHLEPFRLTRKLEAWRAGRSTKHLPPVRRIVSVEPAGRADAVCITVANPDGLYVTERHIVTHNSILIENLALSLTAGMPFLKRFEIDHPTRTLLLDRELSKRSLFERLSALYEAQPGMRAGRENLLIDHDNLIRLDQPNAKETLARLIATNGAEVCILDTAYKFFTGDVEKSSTLMQAFGVLDAVIAETGCAFVLTHHRRKTSNEKGRQQTGEADPDSVAGSFLWTGWPNATILLNFLQRSVENPFNVVASFTAFRDDAPPEPLALYRSRESIAYSAIEEYQSDQEVALPTQRQQISTRAIADMLLEACPITEEHFLHAAAARFGPEAIVRPYYLDALASGDFVKSGRPPIIRFRFDREESSWEEEHNIQERLM